MDKLRLPVSSLTLPEKNIRIHSARQIQEFERSVRMFGQIRPIVVDENNTILAGCGLYETLVKMGIEEAEVYRFTDLTENQKKKLMIADNKVFGLGVDDLETLNSFFEELRDDLDIPGYDEDVLREMVEDADAVTSQIASYGLLEESEIEQTRAIGRQEERMEPERSGSGTATEESPHNAEHATINEPIRDNVETGRYVICPHCGEKIWL